MKKDRLLDYLLNNYFFTNFSNDFLALLLCKIHIIDILNMGDFFKFLIYPEVLKFG